MRRNPHIRRGLRARRLHAAAGSTRRPRRRLTRGAGRARWRRCWRCCAVAGSLAAGRLRARRDEREVVTLLGDGLRGRSRRAADPGIRAPQSRHPRRAAAAALDRRARETADRLRRRCHCRTCASSATPGSRSSPRSMRWSRSTRASPVRRRSRADDYFPGIWDTNVVDGRVYGVPWYVDTRLPYYRRDLLRAGRASPSRRAPGTNGARRWPRSSSRSGRSATRSCCRSTSSSRCSPGAAAGRAAAARRRPARQLPQRRLPAHAGLLQGNVRPAAGRRAVTNTQISNVWDEFGKRLLRFYISGPWNIAEFKQAPAAALPGRVDDDAAARARRPGRIDRRRHRAWCCSANRTHKDAAWKLLEYLSRAATQARFHALTGDLPPRRSAWATPALADDPYARAFRDQLERAKPTPKVPEWERIATEMRAGRRADGQRRARRRRRPPRNSTGAPTRSSRSGAGCSTATAHAMTAP